MTPLEEYQLGLSFYEKGDYTSAVEHFKIGSDAGEPEAVNKLGVCLFYGQGIEKDIPKAISLFEDAAENGCVKAQYNLGFIYEMDDFKDYEKAFNCYLKAAESGDPGAQFRLGMMYYEGKGTEKDLTASFKWQSLSAAQGHPGAMNNLACAYEDGKGTEKNVEEALKWFHKAYEAGNTLSAFHLGVLYEEGKLVEKDLRKAEEFYLVAANDGLPAAMNYLGNLYFFTGPLGHPDYDKAFYWISKAAEKGDVHSYPLLGYMYQYAKGTKRDYKKAFHYYSLGAENGFPDAKSNLGVCYDYGHGCMKDPKRAFELYREAAEEGDEGAMFNLAVDYEQGKGTERDLDLAIKYYTMAAEKGDADACINLGLMYQNGAGVPTDLELAKKWFLSAVEKGEPGGYFSIGCIYYYGNFNGANDVQEAIKWFKKGADAGAGFAQNNLGCIYEEGCGVEKDYTEAFRYYQLAANNPSVSKDGIAQDNLACMYYHGRGVAQDLELAAHWFRIAANRNNSDAQYHLGMMFLEGKGVKQSLNESFKYLRSSANNGNVSAQVLLGNAFCVGKGVDINYHQAVFWWRKAARQGSRDALFNLGCAYAQGLGTFQDWDIARSWWKKGAALEDENSIAALNATAPCSLTFKLSSLSDMELSRLEEKAKSGDVSVQVGLGDIYFQGYDRFESHKTKAAFYYDAASRNGSAEAKFKLAGLYLKNTVPEGIRPQAPEVLLRESEESGYGRAAYVNRILDSRIKQKGFLAPEEKFEVLSYPYYVDEIISAKYGDVLPDSILFRVLTILYAVHSKQNLVLDDDSLTTSPTWDPLLDSLFRYSSKDDSDWAKEKALYEDLLFLDYPVFEAQYLDTLTEVVRRRDGFMNNPVCCPSDFVLDSISKYVSGLGAKRIYVPFAGSGLLAKLFPKDCTVALQDSSYENCLISSILANASGLSSYTVTCSDPLENWMVDGYDAIIILTPLRTLRYASFDAACMQEKVFQKLFDNDAPKTAVILTDHDFNTSTESWAASIRETLLNGGSPLHPEKVFELPKGTFGDVSSGSTILFLRHREVDACSGVTFESAGLQRTIGMDRLVKKSYSLNPQVYLLSPDSRDGQTVYSLSDLFEPDIKGENLVESFVSLGNDDYSSSLLKVLNPSLKPPTNNSGEETFWIKYKGPTIFMRFSDEVKLYYNNSDNYCSNHGGGFALKVNTEIISPRYAAYLLISDRRLKKFIDSISDGNGSFNIGDFLNYEIAIYPDRIVQESIVEEALTAERQATRSRNEFSVALVSDDKERLNGSLKDVLMSSSISIRKSIGGDCASYKRFFDEEAGRTGNPVDAVLVDARAECLYDVLSDLKDYLSKGKHVYLFAIDSGQDLGLRRNEKEYFIQGNRVFGTSPSDLSMLVVKIRDDLDAVNSPKAKVRSQYKDVFEAIDAIDRKYAMDLESSVISFILDGCRIDDDPAAGICGPLRLAGHSLIEVFKSKNMVPKLDPGAVPHLLADRCYNDKNTKKRYYQYYQFMPKYLADALCYFFSITNAGVHGSQDSSIIGHSALSILMEFIVWFHENDFLFDIRVPGPHYYWGEKDDYEQIDKNRDYVVECLDDGKEKYYFSNNVHLKPVPGLKAGSIIRFTQDKLNDEGCPRFDNGLRIVFFANTNQYSVIG